MIFQFNIPSNSSSLNTLVQSIRINNPSGNFLGLYLVKKYEEKSKGVREGDERCDAITENIPVGIYIFQNGKYVFVNNALENISGYTKNEFLNLNPFSLLHSDYVEKLAQFTKLALKGEINKFQPYIVKFVRKDRKYRWVELGLIPIIYRGSRAILATVADITDQMDLENRLRESEEMFRMLAEKSLVGIYLIQDGVFKYLNPRLAEMWGYEVDELIGKNPLDYIYHEDRSKVEEYFRLRFEGKIADIHYKVRTVRKNGKVRINEVFESIINYKGNRQLLGCYLI